MSRIRTIKPDFFKHEGLYDLERDSGFPVRVAYAGLWTVADREGRFEWRPRKLKTDVLPYDDVDFSRVLDALASRGFVVKYACDGVEYGWIPTFKDHQIVNNREALSVIPEPNENNILTRDARVIDASRSCLSGTGTGTGKEEPPVVPLEGDAPKASKSKRGTQIPDDFQLDREFARSLGFTEAEVETEQAKMIDHFKGNGGVKKDWPATGRNWLRRAAEMRPAWKKPAATSDPPEDNGWSREMRSLQEVAEANRKRLTAERLAKYGKTEAAA